MSKSASDRLADLFDFLRSTGTNLPLSNAKCAAILHDALDEYTSPDDAPEVLETIDNLRSDLEVLVEELEFREENDDADN